MELSPLIAAHGSAGGRQFRRDLPPTLAQGGHGFVQAALKPSWEDPLHSFFVVKPFQPTGLGTVLVPCNVIFNSLLGYGLEGDHKPFW